MKSSDSVLCPSWFANLLNTLTAPLLTRAIWRRIGDYGPGCGIALETAFARHASAEERGILIHAQLAELPQGRGGCLWLKVPGRCHCRLWLRMRMCILEWRLGKKCVRYRAQLLEVCQDFLRSLAPQNLFLNSIVGGPRIETTFGGIAALLAQYQALWQRLGMA